MNITETLNTVPKGQNKTAATSLPKRILIIDDEDMVLQVIGAYVRQLGYKEETYSKPEKGLARFAEAPRDYILVILDLYMAGASGKDVLVSARKLRPDIPVILLTYSDECLDNKEIDRLNVQVMLIKPFALETLAEAIAASCNPTTCASGKELSC